jgi:hypothetical protein
VNHKVTLLLLLLYILRDGILTQLTGAASHERWLLGSLQRLTLGGGALIGGGWSPLFATVFHSGTIELDTKKGERGKKPYEEKEEIFHMLSEI